MIIHMRHTLWADISETNVNVVTSATRTHAFNNNVVLQRPERFIYIFFFFSSLVLRITFKPSEVGFFTTGPFLGFNVLKHIIQ